jgi:hypothetical protein
LGGSARNAIEKSRDDEGEEGVTIMAGSSDFSVASERDRSNTKEQNSIKRFVRFSNGLVPRGAGIKI